MKKYYKLLAIMSLFALTACPGDGGDGGGGGGASTQSKAVNAQGTTFAKDFNAPNNSTPATVKDGDAGPVSLTGQPNKVN